MVVYILCMCGQVHILYIVLVEFGDIKCKMMSLNGNILRVAGPLGGESIDHRWIAIDHPHRGSGMKLWYFLPDLRLNKQLSKQSSWWWFEAPSYLLRRHCNESVGFVRTLWLHTCSPADTGANADCPCVCGGSGEMLVKSTSTKVK